MPITLSELPYDYDALAPAMSRETLEYHHDKHHRTYVDKANKLLQGSELANQSLEDIVKSAEGDLFNNAAQVWNHDFFFAGLSPGRSKPDGTLMSAIVDAFGNLEALQKQMSEQAVNNFGSGWTWLVASATDQNPRLSVLNTPNADTPLTDERWVALLTVDVWEHAYYIDYRNDRAGFLKAYWSIVNWPKVQERFDHSEQRSGNASVSVTATSTFGMAQS